MVENVRLVTLEDPRFVKPVKMLYTQEGVEKSWELVQAHDSVAALIYNRDAETFVLVKQFRPPIFLHNRDGYTYELCAGILDKDKSLEQTMAEEISEETGYHISAEMLEKVTVFFTAVGFAGSRQTLFFAEVGNKDKTGGGGGIDAEQIEVIELSKRAAHEFMYDESVVKTSGLLFALYWFFDTKERKC